MYNEKYVPKVEGKLYPEIRILTPINNKKFNHRVLKQVYVVKVPTAYSVTNWPPQPQKDHLLDSPS